MNSFFHFSLFGTVGTIFWCPSPFSSPPVDFYFPFSPRSKRTSCSFVESRYLFLFLSFVPNNWTFFSLFPPPSGLGRGQNTPSQALTLFLFLHPLLNGLLVPVRPTFREPQGSGPCMWVFLTPPMLFSRITRLFLPHPLTPRDWQPRTVGPIFAFFCGVLRQGPPIRLLEILVCKNTFPSLATSFFFFGV